MNDWFEWNGVKCTDLGIHVEEQPPLTLASERATFTNVPGRPGSLTTLEGDDVYDDMILTANCFVTSIDNYEDIAAYLKGSGKVTFATRPRGILLRPHSQPDKFRQDTARQPAPELRS